MASKCHMLVAIILVVVSTGTATDVFKNTKKNRFEVQTSRTREMQNISNFFNNVLKNYDKKLRPNAGGKPVEVEVEFKVVSLGEINEARMEYTMDIFFRQWWNDPRFKHNYTESFTMAEDASKIFWIPDTYFINSMKSSYHRVTKDNARIIIKPDGDVYYSVRLTLVLQCYMNLSLYPMDTQECPLLLESYAYTKQDLYYVWTKRGTKGIEILSKETAQFELVEAKTRKMDQNKISGNFSQLLSTFTFKRRLEYFVITIVTPAIVLVILSWCSFWISPDAIPARISLSITTILSTLLLSGSVNAQMPKVSYLKAIDVFLLGNFAFIFISLVEYVAVLNTTAEIPIKGGLLEKFCKADEGRGETEEISVSERECSSNGFGRRNGSKRSKQNNIGSNNDMFSDMIGFSWGSTSRSYPKGHYIDKISRFFFPIAYVIFINLYWFYYHDLANQKLTQSSYTN